MKIDILDITFMIPVRLDSIVRMENLLASIKSIRRHFKTKIIILEASTLNNGFLRKILPNDVEYFFIKDQDTVFYRTKYLNILTKIAQTPYLAIWDTDVIIQKNQILDSVIQLRKGVDISFPYDGTFLDTTQVIREHYIQSNDAKVLSDNIKKMKLIYGDLMFGGAVFVNKEAYIKAGGENEKFYGWGPEDFERHQRWQVLEYSIHRSAGCLFHLTHPRGINSTFRSADQVLNTKQELVNARDCSISELQEELNKSHFIRLGS